MPPHLPRRAAVALPALAGISLALAPLAPATSGAPEAGAGEGIPVVVEAGFEIRRVAVDLAPVGGASLASAAAAAELLGHGPEADGAGPDPDGAVGAVVPLTGAPGQVVLEVEAPAELAVRARTAGSWGPWTTGHALEDAPDGLALGEGATPVDPAFGPIWLGEGAEAIEVVVLDGDPGGLEVVGLTDTGAGPMPQAGALGVAAPDAGAPAVLGREQWATSGWASGNGGCGSGPRTAARLQAAVVHHTVSVNDYAREQVPELIRGIYWFHTQSRGWCDIAYNVVVDRFGRIWEARSGGLDRAIIGGHTTGFNTGTFGVVALGQFHPAASPAPAAPSAAMLESLARVIQWKFAVHGTVSAGTVRLTSLSDGDLYRTGQVAEVPVVSAHRDLGATACAGDWLVSALPGVRARVADLAFAHHLFRTFVGRAPTDAERVAWAAAVAEEGAGAAATRLAQSEAWAGAMVDRLYEAVLDRPAEPEGRAFWLGRMLAGLRFEDVAVQFYGSAEYVAASGTPEGFVTRLYEALLDRAPEADGLGYWTGELASGRATPASVVAGFYASIESRLERVDALYRSVLGRGPDEPGQRYWADRLLTTDDVLLAAWLAASDEFRARALA